MARDTDDSVATTRSGRLRGDAAEGVTRFLGVPYAAAPVGPLRFLAPQPPAPWRGVRDALAYGPTAPQAYRAATLIPEPTIDGDDYLNLNIFTADLKPARRPVLVWIHGGGFFAGGNVSPWFRGAGFAKAGIVFVSINYRLGVEGFLPIEGAPSNRGLRDWLAALDWVRDNIEAFGGDPSNIAIAGHSAGGMACATLLAVLQARGLFNKAILMSGSIRMSASPKEVAEYRHKFEAAVGAPATLSALASVPMAKIIEAQATVLGREDAPAREVAAGFARGLILRPQVDDDVLPVDPATAIRDGAGGDVAVMVGATSHEFNFVIGEADEADVADALPRFLGDPESIARYRQARAGAPAPALVGQAISDAGFRARAAEVAEARADAPAPTFLYDFRWRPREGLLGSCHCLDVPFAFDCLGAQQVEGIAGANPPQTLADAVHQSWISLIKTGDAGWPAYRRATRSAMVFDDPCLVEQDAMRLERDIWLDGPEQRRRAG